MKKKSTIADIIAVCIAEIGSRTKAKKSTKPRKNPDAAKITKKKNFSIPSIIKSIVGNAVENAKKDGKKNLAEDSNKEYKIINEERGPILNGGYGTVSRENGYAAASKSKYVNYNKLFSYLGSFRSKGMYEDSDGKQFEANAAERTREMVSMETIEKVAKHFKYFVRGEVMGDVGFVPPMGLGVDSKEWEKYRMMSMMSIYRPLIAMKKSSA